MPTPRRQNSLPRLTSGSASTTVCGGTPRSGCSVPTTSSSHSERLPEPLVGPVPVRGEPQAATALQQAGDIFRETGDRNSEGTVWNNLGLALSGLRQLDEAVTAHQHAGDIFRETGDRNSEGMALGNLGVALHELHRFDEAATA